MQSAGVLELVRPKWPPLRHVEHGWEQLTTAERDIVRQRVDEVLADHVWGPHSRDALLHFFTFLAQVETIAIEIPLRFLPHAPEALRPLLRRQLVDEVFHSTIFARLAHELALPESQPPPPLASAERLLQRIREEPDLAVTATLLNLVAEGWIETLFKHALRWKIAPAVFKAVLADEARHVNEAQAYMHDLDAEKAQAAVEAFEQGMVGVSAEPTVALAIRDLAGEKGQRALAGALHRQHIRHLREAGLTPSEAWMETAKHAEEAATKVEPLPVPEEVEDTHWRRMARQLWQTPRDPTMQGDFDVRVGHIPRKILTPVLIAAIGRAWAAHPELNRIVLRDKVWQLPYANVGVRVLLDDNELATVLIPEADRRSVRDIQRMLRDGIAQLQAARKRAAAGPQPAIPDPAVASLMPPLPHMFAVAVSNAGKWGVISGAGCFSGWVSPTTDITIGLRRRLPLWRGVAYVPSWHVNVAAVQDHRVFDGRASATTVTGLQAALSPASVRAIVRTVDTLPSDAELAEKFPGFSWANSPERNGMPPAAAAMGALWLPKYTPFVIGGLGLGALVGIGGYLLYQQYATPAAAAALAQGTTSADGVPSGQAPSPTGLGGREPPGGPPAASEATRNVKSGAKGQMPAPPVTATSPKRAPPPPPKTQPRKPARPPGPHPVRRPPTQPPAKKRGGK